MPLVKGGSRAAMDQNFHLLKQEGYPQKQRVAIVLSTARRYGGAQGAKNAGPAPGKPRIRLRPAKRGA